MKKKCRYRREAIPSAKPPYPPNMASSPISHTEKANNKATGKNAAGQNVTTVMSKTLSKQ